MGRNKLFNDVFIQYYQGIMLFGIAMIVIAIWLYEHYYVPTSDDLMGLIVACAFFFGTLLIGQGIRGWRDGEEFRHLYIKMKSRHGAELKIKKKKKVKKW